jgi:dTDP-4-amino-4,6-dideoxygalactose transaminase
VRVPFLDLKAQYAEIRQTLEPVVLEVLAGGSYVLGAQNEALESEVAALHGCKHGVAVNSGTDALRIALQACDIGPGDQVITTAFTFVASLEAILQVGAQPVLVDIEPEGFQIAPERIEAAITERTKAILPIHLFGQLCDMRSLCELAKCNGLTIVEDAAQAIGSHCDGVFAGKFGRAAAISFYVTKNLGAAGDGGMILTDDDEVARRCRSLRVHGMGRERYYYDEVGYTSRMAELQAAVLRVKLPLLARWHERRRELARIYDEELGDSVVTPITLAGNYHTYHQYTIRCASRPALQQHLREREVDSMIYYPVPLHLHRPYRHLANGPGSLPETERAAEQVLSLPIHQYLSEDQVRWAARCVQEFCTAAAHAESA